MVDAGRVEFEVGINRPSLDRAIALLDSQLSGVGNVNINVGSQSSQVNAIVAADIDPDIELIRDLLAESEDIEITVSANSEDIDLALDDIQSEFDELSNTEIPLNISDEDLAELKNAFDNISQLTSATQVEASQLAGIFDLTAGEAAAVQGSLAAAEKTSQEAATAAQALAQAYGLSKSEIEKVESAVAEVTEESKAAREAFQGLVAGAATAVSASVGVFLNQAVDQFSQFEQFESVLETVFGDETAVRNATSLVSNFADQSVVALTAAEASFASLVNRGINPTAEQLRQLADIAASQGKSIDQLVEAILDAQTGENERLKEFGIQADATGELLQLTFRGINLEVEKTPEAIADALFSLGDLQGVAGAASGSAETLQGRLNTLNNESVRVSRAFGELISSGIEPLVIGATDLLRGFNALPASVKSTVAASTAFVGTLSAAVAAVTTYNLVNGKRVVQEAITTAVLGKNTALQIANTVSLKTATAAQAALAVATGKATAAQQAQIASLGAGAAALGVFAAAVGSVALAANTFLSITKAAKETEEQIRLVQNALDLIEPPDLGNEGGESFIAFRSDAAVAQENIKAIEQELGAVERALDKLRGLNFIFDTTAAEAAVNRQIVKFSELADSVSLVGLRAAEVAVDLENGVDVDASQIQNTVAAIDASIAALEESNPVTAQAVSLRDAQIEKLQEYRDRITDTSAGVANLTETTDGLNDKLKELNSTLSSEILQVDASITISTASLEEQFAAGEISAQDYQSELNKIELNGLNERIRLNQNKLSELRDLESQAQDPEALQQIQDEILKTEITTGRARIEAAQQVQQAQDRIADEFIASQERAISAIELSQSNSIARIRQNQAAGNITADEADSQIADVEAQSIRDRIALREQEITQIEALEARGALSAEEASKQIADARQAAADLGIQAIDQEIEAQDRARQAALDRLDAESQLNDLRAEQINLQSDIASGALQDQANLISAQVDLEQSRLSLSRQSLDAKLAEAEAAEDVVAVEELRDRILINQRQSIQAEFTARRQQLEIQQQLNQLDADRQLRLAQIAEAESRIAVERARTDGAVQSEVDALQSIARLREQETTALASQARTAEDILAIQFEQLDTEQAIAEQRANTERREQAIEAFRKQQKDLADEQLKTEKDLASATRDRQSAAEGIVSALSSLEDVTAEDALSNLDQLEDNLRTARRVGAVDSGTASDLQSVIDQAQRAARGGFSVEEAFRFAQRNADNQFAGSVLDAAGLSGVTSLLDSQQEFALADSQIAEIKDSIESIREEIAALPEALPTGIETLNVTTPDPVVDAARVASEVGKQRRQARGIG